MPLSPDVRTVADTGLAVLAAYVLSGRCGPTRFRVLLVIALVGAGFNAELHRQTQAPLVESRTARYTGTLLERVSPGDGSSQLRLSLDNGREVLANVRDLTPPVGSRLLVRGRLEPFDEARNPGETSEAEIERERGLDGRLASAAVLATGLEDTWDARTWLARAHAWAHAELSGRLGEPAASVVAGELWGERSALPPALRTEFQETGTVHVLVTAGLHVGFVTALCLALLVSLSIPRWSACLAAIALLWTFVAWSGAQLPAERAAIMATFALAARACGRATFSWNALAIAALIVAFLRPASVATTSFALSFSCVGAIFTCAGPLERWIEARLALPARVREALVLSVATQLGTWPLGAATFLQFAPYAVAANLAVVPCVAATMALGGAQLALAWCAPLAQACANCNSWLLAWMLGVIQTVSTLPAAVMPMTHADDARTRVVHCGLRRGAACGVVSVAAGRAHPRGRRHRPRNGLRAVAAARAGRAFAGDGSRRRTSRCDRHSDAARSHAARRCRRPARTRTAKRRLRCRTRWRAYRRTVSVATWDPRGRRAAHLASPRRPRRRGRTGTATATGGRACRQRSDLRRTCVSRCHRNRPDARRPDPAAARRRSVAHRRRCRASLYRAIASVHWRW
jgi:ComEC/Rec2-related protein